MAWNGHFPVAYSHTRGPTGQFTYYINALRVGEGVEILLYCVIIREGVLQSVLYNTFC